MNYISRMGEEWQLSDCCHASGTHITARLFSTSASGFAGGFRKWLTDWLLVANLYQVILRLSVMRNALLLKVLVLCKTNYLDLRLVRHDVVVFA